MVDIDEEDKSNIVGENDNFDENEQNENENLDISKNKI